MFAQYLADFESTRTEIATDIDSIHQNRGAATTAKLGLTEKMYEIRGACDAA